MEDHQSKNKSFDSSQKDTKKYSDPDQCMFFVGGKKNKKLKVDPKNLQKYNNMFQEDEEPIEDAPIEEPKEELKDEDSFEKILAAKKNTSAFRMKHSRKRTLDQSTVEPVIAPPPKKSIKVNEPIFIFNPKVVKIDLYKKVRESKIVSDPIIKDVFQAIAFKGYEEKGY